MALADEDASVVDRLGEAALEDLGLEAALEEVLDLEGEDVVEAHALLVEDADADQAVCKDESQCGFIRRPRRGGAEGEWDAPTDQGVALEETLRVLLVELEELTSSTTDLGEDEGDPPDLVLVLETVLAGELELGVETSRLERAARDLCRRRRAVLVHGCRSAQGDAEAGRERKGEVAQVDGAATATDARRLPQRSGGQACAALGLDMHPSARPAAWGPRHRQLESAWSMRAACEVALLHRPRAPCQRECAHSVGLDHAARRRIRLPGQRRVAGEVGGERGFLDEEERSFRRRGGFGT